MKSLLSLILMVFMVGCATRPAQNIDSVNPDQASSVELPRPDVELDGRLVYLLLLGELSGMHKDLVTSMRSYGAAALATDDWEVAKRATHIAAYAGYDQEALEMATRWYELVPEDLDAVKAMAGLNMRLQKIEQAKAFFAQLYREPSIQQEANLQPLAAMLVKEAQNPGSLIVARYLLETFPQDLRLYRITAQIASVQQDYVTALSITEDAIARDPRDTDLQMLKANILLQSGQPGQAIALLQNLVKKNRKNASIRITLARALLSLDRLEEAQAHFEILEKQTPDDPDVLYTLALLLLEQNDVDHAKPLFERLVGMQKRLDDACFYLGRIAEYQRDFENAVHWYGLVRGGQNAWESQLGLVRAYGRTDQLFKAQSLLERLRNQNPVMRDELYAQEGELLYSLKKYQEAYDLYSYALEHATDKLDLYYGRALAAEKLDILDQAEEDLKRILEVEPAHAHALNALGYTLADRTDRYAEALQYILKAYEIMPEDPAILDSMGWVKYRMGDLDEAIEFLSDAYEKSQDPEIAVHFGEVLWVTGEQQKARKIFEQASRDYPDDDRATKTLKRLGQ